MAGHDRAWQGMTWQSRAYRAWHIQQEVITRMSLVWIILAFNVSIALFRQQSSFIIISVVITDQGTQTFVKKNDFWSVKDPLFSKILAQILIGWLFCRPWALIMYHQADGTRQCPFPVTGNRHEWVSDPKEDQFYCRYFKQHKPKQNRLNVFSNKNS